MSEKFPINPKFTSPTSAEEAKEIRTEVIAVLGKGKPLLFDELYNEIKTVNAKPSLSSALFRLKQLRAIEQDPETKRYRLADGLAKPTAGQPQANCKPRAGKRTGKTRAVAEVVAGVNDTQRVLEQLLRDTQRALDDYVYAVGDRQILDGLKAARDAAGAAFQAWLNAGR